MKEGFMKLLKCTMLLMSTLFSLSSLARGYYYPANVAVVDSQCGIYVPLVDENYMEMAPHQLQSQCEKNLEKACRTKSTFLTCEKNAGVCPEACDAWFNECDSNGLASKLPEVSTRQCKNPRKSQRPTLECAVRFDGFKFCGMYRDVSVTHQWTHVAPSLCADIPGPFYGESYNQALVNLDLACMPVGTPSKLGTQDLPY
jgi:hypothetical protein